MYSFNDDEKKFIDCIISKTEFSINFINITSHLCDLSSVNYLIDIQRKSCVFKYHTTNGESDCTLATKRESELTRKLLTYLLLIEFLETENLIYIYTPANSSNKTIGFGNGAINIGHIDINIYDEKLITLIIRYAYKELIPKHTLINLKSMNYLSLNEFQSERQIKIATFAIIVSILIGLIGLFKPTPDQIDLSPIVNSINNITPEIYHPVDDNTIIINNNIIKTDYM